MNPDGSETLDERLLAEAKPKTRTEAARDRDRVLYSSAFARLSGITQVTTPVPGLPFHNRLTHTLKVGQIASRLANALRDRYPDSEAARGLDPEAAEASAFAHDLGHPPFGHVGEAVLHELAETHECGGFEANAQSFRVVTKVALRSVLHPGLNLTRRTLDGFLKYPWLRGSPPAPGHAPSIERRKWGAYDPELRDFNFARGLPLDGPAVRTRSEASLAAQIIDWADDVTYAIHDLEDFYKAGLIPLQDLVTRDAEAQSFFESFFSEGGELSAKFREPQPGIRPEELTPEVLEAGLESLRALFRLGLARPYDASVELRALIRKASSYLIGEYFDGTQLTQGSSDSRLLIDPALRAEVAVLKELLWYYVIGRPSLAAIQHGHRRALRDAFELLSAAAGNRSEWRMFPTPVRDALAGGPGDGTAPEDQSGRARIVIDYLAGMAELELWELHRVTSGFSRGSLR